MKKMTLILFTMFFVTIGNINAERMRFAAEAFGQKETPENIRCKGKWVSGCVPHDWHGCSDDIGCR